MPEFLAENNVCGQIVLNLVSRGNAIIAELLRLKDNVPKLYTIELKGENQKYNDIILDFSYFEITSRQEKKIETNEILRDIDEEHRDNHIEIISRFYSLFESIHIYISDLIHFLGELDDGIYINQSLETIFLDIEGKQLLCEALYLYGLMLLLADVHIKGAVREKLLVSYYRYTPQKGDARSSVDEVCKLLRDTGFHTKKPQFYPEDYFSRIKLNDNFIDIVIGRLRTDDIYGQLSIYPLPKHRSTALATQASMLYVCLYFSPSILHSQTAIMREIVDKYFPDNWVISLYMGYTINLAEVWEPFKAAKLALNNTLETINIKSYANSFGTNIQILLKKSATMLKEGNLNKTIVLKDINNIINLLRECNVTVRWLMLHTLIKPGTSDKNKKCKQLRDLVLADCKTEDIQVFKLLINTAQLELHIKEIFKNILTEKETQWNDLKLESHKSVIELSEVFSGTKPLSRIKKNENLEKWFTEIAKQIDMLIPDDLNSSRKIVQLIQALEEVQEFHQLESNMQIIQYLTETRQYLKQMIQTSNIKEDNLITMQIIGDLSYAWELIETYTRIMQQGIKKEPPLVIKLRALFLKLSSALEIPLLRINQAHSEDLVSVSEYYSRELEVYVRKVLQIIPKMMFEKLASVIEMQTSVLKELPTKIEKDKLKKYAQLDERLRLAELTHSISVLSQGMRMMKTTLVGVVCLDPKKLLEDGIRNELVQRISKALHVELIFNPKAKISELEQKITSLAHIMDGHKRSFEYIQDYINLNGLKIWQEEVTRIVNYNVEQECNGFLRIKVQPSDSKYQNRFIPIPIFAKIDSVSENFIGRLAREIIRITDPRYTVYVDQTTSWYDIRTHKEVLNRQFFKSLAKAIEIAGVVGLDRLFCFMIVTNLQKVFDFLENKNIPKNVWYNIIANIQKELSASRNEEVPNPYRFYQNCINRTTKIWVEFLHSVLLIGQLQLLRKILAFQLNLSASFNARNLESTLQTLSKTLMYDMQNEDFVENEDMIIEISKYFDYMGINNPYQKVYCLSPNPKFEMSVILFVFVTFHAQKLFYCGPEGSFTKRSSEQIDGYTFSLGVHTIFKQLNDKLNDNFVFWLSKYIKDYLFYHNKNHIKENCMEAFCGINFLQEYSKLCSSNIEVMRKYLPDELVHLGMTSPILNLSQKS